MCRENRLKRGVAERGSRAGGKDFNMYEKMHDTAGERETQGAGLKLPSIFIITFIRESSAARRLSALRAVSLLSAPPRTQDITYLLLKCKLYTFMIENNFED